MHFLLQIVRGQRDRGIHERGRCALHLRQGSNQLAIRVKPGGAGGCGGLLGKGVDLPELLQLGREGLTGRLGLSLQAILQEGPELLKEEGFRGDPVRELRNRADTSLS